MFEKTPYYFVRKVYQLLPTQLKLIFKKELKLFKSSIGFYSWVGLSLAACLIIPYPIPQKKQLKDYSTYTTTPNAHGWVNWVEHQVLQVGVSYGSSLRTNLLKETRLVGYAVRDSG